jgi:hypothetical protein
MRRAMPEVHGAGIPVTRLAGRRFVYDGGACSGLAIRWLLGLPGLLDDLAPCLLLRGIARDHAGLQG